MRRRIAALDALCALFVAGLAAAWLCGILRRYFDYDEFEHLYAIWRIKSGGRPFYDFFEVHPPFVWYPLALALPLYGLLSSPLFSLRILSAAGHVTLLIALAKNVSLSLSRLPRPIAFPRRAFIVGTLVFAGHLSVIWYLLEFRVDAWPQALLFLEVYHYRKRADRPFPSAFQLAFVSTLALLCAPKIAGFFAWFGLFTVVTSDRRLLRAAGLAAGGVAALLVAWLFLTAVRIDPRVVYHACVSYHLILATKGGYGHGLAAALWGQPQLVVILGTCLAGWLLFARGRLAAFPFELAVIAFLGTQAAIVAFGHPQYYAPWFLLCIVFVPYLDLGLRGTPAAHRLLVAAGLLFAVSNVYRDLRTFTSVNQTDAVVAFNAWARPRVPADAAVAGEIWRLPIYRRALFFHLASSVNPSGYSTEDAVHESPLPEISERMTPAAYDRELELSRPAMIVSGRMLSRMATAAIARYLARHRAEYHLVDSPEGPVYLRLDLPPPPTAVRAGAGGGLFSSPRQFARLRAAAGPSCPKPRCRRAEPAPPQTAS